MEPADVACRVWLHDRRVLERTRAQISASKPRRFEYFQTYHTELEPFSPPDDDRLLPLEEALDHEFVRRGRGRGLRVFAYPHDYDCLFLVRHGEPIRREGTLKEGVASSVLFRPLGFDIVAYDPHSEHPAHPRGRGLGDEPVPRDVRQAPVRRDGLLPGREPLHAQAAPRQRECRWLATTFRNSSSCSSPRFTTVTAARRRRSRSARPGTCSPRSSFATPSCRRTD